MHTVLELGRASLCGNVTTDHPADDWVIGRAGLPPPPGRPPRRDGGGGDGHLPGRLQLLVTMGLLTLEAVVLALAIVRSLERAAGAR